MKRLSLHQGVYLLPSLCTTASLFFGFFSIIRAIHGDYWHASIAIFLSAVFDILDGRLARMTKTVSAFGIEYDSLADLVSFALAPALLLYNWHLRSFGRIGWLIAFLFFACGALRLARYNVQATIVEKKRFFGMPTPAAGMMLASFVLFYLGNDWKEWKDPLSIGLMVLLAILMVSKIRFRSFKDLDMKSPNAFYFLVGAVAVIFLIGLSPTLMLFPVGLLYLLSGPIEEWFLFLRGSKKKADRPLEESRKFTLLSAKSQEKGSE